MSNFQFQRFQKISLFPTLLTVYSLSWILELALGALFSNLGEDGGRLSEEGAYLIFPKSWHDHCFNTSSARKQQHKLFIESTYFKLILNFGRLEGRLFEGDAYSRGLLIWGFTVCQNLEPIFSSKNILSCIKCNISLYCLQSFGDRPSVFVSAKYARSTKPDDAMYVWLENVNSGSFEVCIREFLPFDGKHQNTIVVREILLMYFWDFKSPLALKMWWQ